MAFRTRPRGAQLSFLTECIRCRGELSVTQGRIDRHDCFTVWATHEEVAEGQAFYRDTMTRLNAAFDNR